MQLIPHQTRIIVGMSGGVDSSVAALMLKQQGYLVEGLFMKNWEEDDRDDYCSAAVDLRDVQAVCTKLNITLHTMNFSAEYWDNVFTHFLAELKLGRTPNPDILCNNEIKFKAFLDYALTLGADYIATGHYVQRKSLQGQAVLLTGIDANKDQSYFLYGLNKHQLNKSLFPIGHLQKSDVRQIAARAGLPNHNKKDSTGICFIGERKFKDFLATYLPAQPGDILSETGEVLGHHEGLMYYTIGQRQGLGIGGQAAHKQAPWYVAHKDLANNTLVVVQGNQHPALLTRSLLTTEVTWQTPKHLDFPLHCTAKTRYRQKAAPAVITPQYAEGTYHVCFTEPQRAITPGQSVVFYHDALCLGGGIIAQHTEAIDEHATHHAA